MTQLLLIIKLNVTHKRFYPGGPGLPAPKQPSSGSQSSGNEMVVFENKNPENNKPKSSIFKESTNINSSQVWVPLTEEELLQNPPKYYEVDQTKLKQYWVNAYHELRQTSHFHEKTVEEKYKIMLDYIKQQGDVDRWREDTETPGVYELINYVNDARSSLVRGVKNTVHNLKENIFSFISQNTEPDINDYLKVSTFIQSHIDKKEIISSSFLNKWLNHLNDPNTKDIINSKNSENFENSLNLLRQYYVVHKPPLEDIKLFLEIWKANEFKFKSLYEIKPTEKIVTISKGESATKPLEKLSHEEKIKDFLKKRDPIVNKMIAFFENHYDNAIQIQKAPELLEWCEYLENRGGVLPLDQQEIEINNKLKFLFEKYSPSEKDLLDSRNDELQLWKKETNLPIHLQEEIADKCYLPEDYESEIKKMKNMIKYLEECKDLSENALKILSINSLATTLDEEGNFKITQQGYLNISANSEYLGLKYLDSHPQFENIMQKIKDKQFFIANDIAQKNNTIVATAHLAHKTLVIEDANLGQNIYIRIGIVTSAKDDKTFCIDDNQITNPDPVKQNKAQMFRIPSHFIIVDKNEPLNIDLEMTLWFYSQNNRNENIIDILYREFESLKEIWSNKPYLFSYEGNSEFIRKLSLIFFKERLQQYTKEFEELQQKLVFLNKEERDEAIETMKAKKNNYLQEKKDNQYYSRLPIEFQILLKSIKLFETKLEKDKRKIKKQELKAEKARILTINKIKQQENNQDTGIKKAKQKKEDYLKIKEQLSKDNKDA